jgi:hypothetical protein
MIASPYFPGKSGTNLSTLSLVYLGFYFFETLTQSLKKSF